MTLLDVALAVAARSKVEFSMHVVTIDMSVSFVRPGSGKLTAVGYAIGGGSSVCLCEGELLDENGRLVAKAIGTFKYRRKNKHATAANADASE
jgi:uncharacterized protein (TIGR00369 family)